MLATKCTLDDDKSLVNVFIDGVFDKMRPALQPKRAGIGLYWGENHPLNVSMPTEQPCDNVNQVELAAAIYALRIAKQIGLKRVRLITDSTYVINSMRFWWTKYVVIDGYIDQPYLKSFKCVRNVAEIRALYQLCLEIEVNHWPSFFSYLQVVWKYSPGRMGIYGNTMAHRFAMAGKHKVNRPDVDD